jgi:hypothetical protein
MDNKNQEKAVATEKNLIPVLTKEKAINEIIDFVEKNEDKKIKDWEAERDYPQVLQAMQEGLLIFDDNLLPTYTLKHPVKNAEGQVSISVINFKTRIKPQTLADIMKGLNIGQNQIEYTLRCLSYIIQQPKAMLDKFSKFDYKVMEQITTVFL